jgi:hypothetical protein
VRVNHSTNSNTTFVLQHGPSEIQGIIIPIVDKRDSVADVSGVEGGQGLVEA